MPQFLQYGIIRRKRDSISDIRHIRDIRQHSALRFRTGGKQFPIPLRLFFGEVGYENLIYSPEHKQPALTAQLLRKSFPDFLHIHKKEEIGIGMKVRDRMYENQIFLKRIRTHRGITFRFL